MGAGAVEDKKRTEQGAWEREKERKKKRKGEKQKNREREKQRMNINKTRFEQKISFLFLLKNVE